MSVATVRWKAVRPLAICGALGLGAWILFADRVAKDAVESVGTTLIGATVEIRRLHLDVPHARVEVRGLTVASPFEALQNLLEADELVADVDPLPLLEKKVVIDLLFERSEEHTSELQSRLHLVCRLLLEKKKKKTTNRLMCVMCQEPNTGWPW